jgi:hypothetical protein
MHDLRIAAMGSTGSSSVCDVHDRKYGSEIVAMEKSMEKASGMDSIILGRKKKSRYFKALTHQTNRRCIAKPNLVVGKQ